MRSPTRTRWLRPGFTIVPVALVLWIVLVVLGVLLWQKTPPPGYVPSRGVGPGQIEAVLLAVGYGAFWFVMLSPMAEKRGQGFASAIACVLYILPSIVLGLSLAGLTADQRNLAKRGPNMPFAVTTHTAPSTAPPRRIQRVVPSQTPPAEVENPDSSPTPTPTAAPATLSPTPAAPAVTPQRQAPTPPSPAVQPTIDAFAREMDAQVKAVADAAGSLLPELSRTPPHDLTKVKKRLEDVEALRALAEPLAKRLRDAIDGLIGKLQGAGVENFEAHRAAMEWASEYHAATRSFGADAITRVCDKAKAECENLRDNIGRWTVDSKGEFKSNDRQFLTQLKRDRFFVKAEADRKAQILGQLDGKQP